ncbi:MAG TPA: hypothetical protein VF434_12255 [Promineifilum sp.]
MPGAIVYMIRNRDLPVIDLPVIGRIRGLSGPFEILGINAMIRLAILWLAINFLWFPAAIWLWKSRRKGGMMASGLLAVSLLFWFGFALPFPPLFGLLQAGLLAAGWKSLWRSKS